MKRLIASLLALVALGAQADATNLILTQRNVTDTGNVTRVMANPPGDSFIYWDSTTLQPLFLGIGSGMTITSGVLNVSAGGAPACASITDATVTGCSLLTASTAALARAAIGAGTSSFSGVYTDLAGIPSTFAPAAHTQAWSTITSTPSTLAGYGITDGVTTAGLSATLGGYATQSALTSGLAAKFNTPTGTTAQYVRGDGSLATLPAPGAGTVTSITAGTGLSGGTITASGTISLPNVGTAGSYSGVTTDPQGRVTAGTTRSASNGARALNSCFQISATRDALVSYAVDVTTTVTLGGTPEGSVFLRTYTNSGCSAGQVGVISGSSGQPTTLTVSVGQQIKGSVNLYGMVPAGTWARIETANTSGTPAFSIRADQQEVQL
ncbi:MAG: hypothetical protein EBR82_09575 [Caulobacteraceae bacterium]|nr:hypothetical protein [Caulobacteraceae bacterium]